MFKRFLFAAMVAAIAVNMGQAQSRSTTTVNIPVGKTQADNGKQMFGSYCAPCHGMDGRGRGPTASALTVAPPDLTVLRKNNHGTFPETHIVSVLQFGPSLPAHGSSQMPIWGPILGTADDQSLSDQARALRIRNLTRYIQSIQEK